MKLTKTLKNSFFRFIFYSLSIFLFVSKTNAQCLTNILNNPSFESPVVNTINGNNLVGSSWSGWNSQGGAGMNIIRVNGSNYISGADNAAHGTQYLDIAGASDYPIQTFTIAVPSICYFSGKFSNRETNPGFANWNARVDILNNSNSIVASSNSKLMTISVNMEIWYMLAGESAILAPGTYKYRAFVGDFGHFDDAFLCVQPAASVCTNRIPEASFESPAQPTNNMTTTVGSTYNGWYTQNGSNIQLTKVDGTGYSLGPDVAIKGSQYMSVSSTNDFILKNFNISCPTTVNFSGFFANRPNASYVNWTGRIDILNSSNAVIASSTTQAFTNSTPKDIWYQLSGTTASLPIGSYKCRITLGREGNFDDGYICIANVSCAVLPIILKTFTVTKSSQGAFLTWTTAQEVNNSNFKIQHSIDGINWQQLGTEEGAGNSNVEKTYHFVHKMVSNGTNYYRILQNDYDGKESVSDVRQLQYNTDKHTFSIKQHSIGSRRLELNLTTNQGLMIFAADGTQLFKSYYKAGVHSIYLDKYASGIYLLSNGQQTERFIIQ